MSDEGAVAGSAPESVERWEVSGGTWRIARAGEDSATVELLRCDGGEVVELLRITDPGGIAWARAELRRNGGER